MLGVPLFLDREDAGKQLATAIQLAINHGEYSHLSPVIYGLPRGGLPVAVPIARHLHCPLTAIIAKKITLPDNPELAVGAVTADGSVLWSPYRPENLQVQETALEQAQTKAREQFNQFSPHCPSVDVEGKLAILVDDGIATGMTMLAAAQALGMQKPASLWMAVPVAPLEMIPYLETACDQILVLAKPSPFFSVSRFYEYFPQVTTEAALLCLEKQQSWLI